MKTLKLKTKKYIVAYIDMLGMKNDIKEDLFDHHLNLIFDLYNRTVNYISSIAQIKIKEFEYKIFSDNFVFAFPVEELTKEERIDSFKVLMMLLSAFQFDFIKHFKLLRGGIVLEDFYIDQNFVYGKALLDAYYLENEVAVYPRIILDKKLVQYVKTFDYLKEDFDANCYIDYLSDLFEMPELKEQIPIIQERLILLAHSSKGVKERAKCLWLVNKFNLYCEESKIADLLININQIDELALKIQQRNRNSLMKREELKR